MAEKKKVITRKHVKNVRQTKKHHARNVEAKTALKLALKNARTAVAAKAADAQAKLMSTISILDKAAERGIIHPNKAARLKSRLNLAYNKTK